MTPEHQQQTLLRRRGELRKRLEEINRDYQRGLDPDLEEQAVQLENAEVLAEIARTTRVELERVERQLTELEQAGHE
jgi:RNA polymerase-binding transcription factor DksA